MADPKLRIMGNKLILSEHSMRPRMSNPGDRLRGTMWSITGQESTPRQDIDTLRRVDRQILGLNDLISCVPFVSEQSPHMNGWHRILRAATNLKEHAGKTLCLDWELQTLTVDAELELRLSGMTLPNSLNTSGRPHIGVPAAARGVFFPRGTSTAIPVRGVTGEDGKEIFNWQPSDAAAREGIRFALDAESGADGQCTILYDGIPVVGLRPQMQLPDTWMVTNGLIRIMSVTTIDKGRIRLQRWRNGSWNDVVDLSPFSSLSNATALDTESDLSQRLEIINIPENEMHSCTIILNYKTPDRGVRRLLVLNLRRGSSIVSMTMRGEYSYIRLSSSISKADPYLYSGDSWVAGTNLSDPDGLKNFVLYMSRNRSAGFIGVPTGGGSAARLAMYREWIGARGAFLNWVLR